MLTKILQDQYLGTMQLPIIFNLGDDHKFQTFIHETSYILCVCVFFSIIIIYTIK